MDIDKEWTFFSPNTKHIYKINIYDDSIQAYAQYVNKWLINGKWKGKCSIVNLQNPSIQINSISRWKLFRI